MPLKSQVLSPLHLVLLQQSTSKTTSQFYWPEDPGADEILFFEQKVCKDFGSSSKYFTFLWYFDI